MKLQSIRLGQRLYIDWWLMNHCSWRCSYCHEQLRNGSIDLVSATDCLRFIDIVTEHAADHDQICDFNFTGGEVTEWNEFSEIIARAKARGGSVRFRSNANCPIELWRILMQSTDSINIDLHPEHTLISKFMLALDLAVKESVSVTVNANMMRDRWEEIEHTCSVILDKYPMVKINRKIVFQDPIFNSRPQEYDSQQISKIKCQQGDLKFTDSHGQIEITDYQTLVLESKNVFTDWQCEIGREQIIIDAWGRIYRGHCRIGGKIGDISDKQISWPRQPVTCVKELCRNAFDIQATKSL